MTRTTIATVLATVLGASLAAAQTTTPAKPTVPTAPTMPSTPSVPTVPSTSGAAGAATGAATGKPTTPTAPSTASTTAPAGTGSPSTGSPSTYKTEADAKTACGSDTVVWHTSRSKVFHLSGDKYYGHTHHGAYMCQKDAVAAGYHASSASTKPATPSATHS
ncbi:MAG TPA: hypothetical protein VJY39_07365 [Acidisphaera sp.]|nr:hypothetical protein [Acidisphaera sp.]